MWDLWAKFQGKTVWKLLVDMSPPELVRCLDLLLCQRFLSLSKLASTIDQARLAAVSAAPGVVGLSLDLDQISATYLSKEIQILVRPKYCAHCNAGTTPENKISRLASSVSRLAKQVRPLAPNDAFYGAFTTGSLAAAQDVFLSIFGLTMPC